MPRRERDLYRYRPDDVSSQRRDAERLQQRRDEELRDVSEHWEGELKDRLQQAPMKQVPEHTLNVHGRRKAGRVHRILSAIFGARLTHAIGRRGRHRRRRDHQA